MKFKRILSFALAVAMTATLSSVNVFAEKVSDVSIYIDGNFNETMNFKDITLPEIVTKTKNVELIQEYQKTLTFTDDNQNLETSDPESESGSWRFELGESKEDIVEALDGIDEFKVTDITVEYDWDGTVDSAGISVDGRGLGEGGDTHCESNPIPLNTATGTGTVTASELNGANGITEFHEMYVHANATGDTGNSFTLSVTKVTLKVSYTTTEGDYDNWRDLGWHMAAHSPGEDEGDRSADIADAILAKEPDLVELGHTINHWDYVVKDITVNYTVTVTSSKDDKDIQFDVFPFVCGEGGDTKFEDGVVFSRVSGRKTHTDTVSASEVIADGNNSGSKSISSIDAMDIYVGMATEDKDDTISLKINSISLKVDYEKPEGTPPILKPITYSQVKNAKTITVTCEAAEIGKCGHENHINEETSVDEGEGKTYCPWVDASFHNKDENGELGWPAYVMDHSKGTYSDDGSEVTFVFDASDIQDEIGTFASGKEYILATWQTTSSEYSIKNDGSSSGGGSSSSSSSSTTKKEEKVDVKEETEKIEDAEKGEKVEVKIEGTVVPEDYIETAMKNDAIVIVSYGEYEWQISDVTDPKAVDLSIDTNAVGKIKKEIVETLEGDNTNVIDIKHNGNLGFKGTLKYNVKKENAGKYVNLYYYNIETGKLELQGSTKIDEKGFVHLPFTHCSTYVLNITSDPAASTLFEDLAAGEGVTAEEIILK